MKRFTLALVFAVVAVTGTTISLGVSAQEILLEGPLAGAPAVRKLVQYRRMRFSVGPQFSYTLNNEYMHNFLLGLRLEFDFTDWFGIGAVGYYGFNAPTKLTKHIEQSRDIGDEPTVSTTSNWPSYTGSANFENQVAKLKGVYLAQVSFVPFRGKMSVFEKGFVAIDWSIFVGGGVVQFEERRFCTATPRQSGTDDCGGRYQNGQFVAGPNNVELETHIGGTFTWGLNFVIYFNNWVGMNVEFRMTPFKWNAGGTDEAGQAASTWNYENDNGDPTWAKRSSGDGDYPDGSIDKDDRQWNLNMSIALGVIFYFPLTPDITE
jgi:outer membrane beta-barrel protein